jgi:hypothetical protein
MLFHNADKRSHSAATAALILKEWSTYSPQLLPNNDLLIAIYAVDLEHVLGDIQTNRGNLHVDGSLV